MSVIQVHSYIQSSFGTFFCCSLNMNLSLFINRNPDSAEKRHRPGSCLVDIDGHQDENDKAFFRPLLAGSRAYFNFYINEEDQGQGKKKIEDKSAVIHNRARVQQGSSNGLRGNSSSGLEELEEDIMEAVGHKSLSGLIEENKKDRECAFLSHFNIPNLVNLDHSSTLGEDDLLYEPSVILEHQSQNTHR